MTKDDIEKWVWFYYSKGMSIIPIGNKKSGKEPNIPTWENYIYARPTEEEIKQWLKAGLFEKIGIICGAVSGNLVVFDIDDADLVDNLGLDLSKTGRNTWIVQTGRGYHVYVKSNKNPGGTQKQNKLKIEHRANGGYVVAPPSFHKSSHQYKFLNAKTPDDLPELGMRNTDDMWKQLIIQVSQLKGVKLTKAA